MAENNCETQQPHILKLNDYCFFEIYKYLSVIDWANLRETCTRLRNISDEKCFVKLLKFLEFNAVQEKSTLRNAFYADSSIELKVKLIYGLKIDTITIRDAKRLIRNFGHFILKLKIHGISSVLTDDFTKLIRVVHRYCDQLRDLKLERIYFDSTLIKACKSLFSNLHRLVIDAKKMYFDECGYDEIMLSTCLSHCTSIKELELTAFSNIHGQYLGNEFINLESVTLKYCIDFKWEYIRQFFAKNRQLKTLTIVTDDYDADYTVTGMFQDICNYLPNLEELRVCFRTYEKAFIHPVKNSLEKVKILELDIGYDEIYLNPILMPLAAYKNIYDLHLASIKMNDELTETICRLKTLQKLTFTYVEELNGNMYNKFAFQLPSLMEITINNYHYTEELIDIFSSLIKALQGKENKDTLTLYLDSQSFNKIKRNIQIKTMLIEQVDTIKLLPLEEESIHDYHIQKLGENFELYKTRFSRSMDF